MRIILASASKQRQDIFNMIGLKYDVITSDVPEESNKIEPDKYVEELSLNKAKSVKKQIKDKAIIISADTIIYSNNKIYEKPKSKEEAYSNLKELSNNKCTAYTGITLMDLYKEKIICSSSKVNVYFNEIKDEEAEWYVNNEEKTDLAEIKDEELDSLYINMDFLGLNLAQVPTKSSDWKAYIIPILYVISSFVSTLFKYSFCFSL